MIKSWNHENVQTAMRDGLWASQEKNEQLLTDAYNTSRYVVLFFSVNKSQAFQGYVSSILTFTETEIGTAPVLIMAGSHDIRS